MELASVEISSAVCPHCGATNVFRGFTVIEAFICQECGEGVSIEPPVQRYDSSHGSGWTTKDFRFASVDSPYRTGVEEREGSYPAAT